jgi:multicomponent Na+:H+ antiporter subunit G
MVDFTPVLQALAAVLLLLGIAFSIFGVIGILRLPDTYSKLHASGKTSTLAILFFCAATVILLPSGALKVLALAGFLVFSSPVSSHAIASAVYRSKKIEVEEEEATEGRIIKDVREADADHLPE